MMANRYIALLAGLLMCSLCACKEPSETAASTGNDLDDAFQRTSMSVVNDNGVEHTLDVYLAVDFEQKRRGLLFVRSLPELAGMLFVYDETAVHSMWMKNTYISLDMVFARADGSVSSVIHDTTPLSLESQSSREPVNYVLELNAGTARRLNIGRSSKIVVPERPDN